MSRDDETQPFRIHRKSDLLFSSKTGYFQSGSEVILILEGKRARKKKEEIGNSTWKEAGGGGDGEQVK